MISGTANIMAVEREVDRVLNLLRSKIHERGFTQLRVQKALGWGRTYISQLFRKQKSLRFDQILQILGVIEIDPAEFFAEFYRLPRSDFGSTGGYSRREVRRYVEPGSDALELLVHLEAHDPHRVVQSLVQLLVDKGVLSGSELQRVIDAQEEQESARELDGEGLFPLDSKPPGRPDGS